MLPFPHGFRPIVWWNAPESETRFTKVVRGVVTRFRCFPRKKRFYVMMIPRSPFVLDRVDLVRENLCNFVVEWIGFSGQVAPTYKAAMYKDAGLVISCL